VLCAQQQRTKSDGHEKKARATKTSASEGDGRRTDGTCAVHAFILSHFLHAPQYHARHTMTPQLQQENGSMTATTFPKDWLLTLVKKYSAQNTQNTPLDLHNEKILAVAPMVDQSDLPFRLLCRKYGANVAFTPMIHCKMFCTREIYRRQFFNLVDGTPASDRPLIAQLCGSDAEYVIQTALLLQQHVDGIDLNCGCPQGVSIW